MGIKLRPAYLVRLGDATSQWANVFLLNGDPNESISGRSFREGWWIESWIDAILGRFHCRDAYIADVLRARNLAVRHTT